MKTFEHRKNPDSSSFGHFAYFCSVKTNDHIRKAMQDRILLLDGAMGTMLQQRGQSGKTRPRRYGDQGRPVQATREDQLTTDSHLFLLLKISDLETQR